jgi:hypothetical protein
MGKAASVDEAVKRGVETLKLGAGKLKGFTFKDRRLYYRELLLWTYLNSGVPADDPEVKSLLTEMLEDKLESTFGVSLQAMVLERLDRAKYQKRLAMCAQFLVDNQSAQGMWGYGSPSIYVEDMAYDFPAKPGTAPAKRIVVEKKRDGDEGDQINAFFAALGLRACRDAGIFVKKPVLDLAIQWNRTSHKRPGVPSAPLKGKEWTGGSPAGWCYRDHADHEAYGSPTAATVAAQAVWFSLWDEDGGKKLSWKKDKSVQDGVAWLLKNYSVTYNPGPYEHAQMTISSKNQYLFYLFALGQAMVLLGIDDLGGHAWHAEGSKVLLEAQQENGAWGGFGVALRLDEPDDLRGRYATSSLADTCFAILFLKKAGQQLPDTTKPKK